MRLKHATRLGVTALIIAWLFDQLFWRKTPGISIFIFILLCLAGGWLVTRWEGASLARPGFLLAAGAVFFGAMTFVRLEPFSTLVNLTLALACLAILAMTWRGGRWLQYSPGDYFTRSFQLLFASLTLPLGLQAAGKTGQAGNLGQSAGGNPEGEPVKEKMAQLNRRQVFAILRGMLLALPVVAVLAALLSQADPIFSAWMERFLSLFHIENLAEYIFRLFYIVVLAYVLMGIFLNAVLKSGEELLYGLEKPGLASFLGITEAAIILASVNLLFSVFVTIQVRYFFGGQVNIQADGYTYAEYARRGFGELVAVAVISLVLFFGLSSITHRKAPLQKRIFSGLGILLLALVATILVSSYQRLLMYETAYGFSRVRTYTHVFLVWVGILLALTVGIELKNRLRVFALAGLVCAAGFAVSMNLINVDGFIASQNINRAVQGTDLDAGYLLTLSDDSVPEIVSRFDAASPDGSLREELGAVLACRQYFKDSRPAEATWPSFHLSRATADLLLQQRQDVLTAYPVTMVENRPQVGLKNLVLPCLPQGQAD